MIDLIEDARRIHAAKINAVINMTVLDMLKSGEVNRAGYDLAFRENFQKMFRNYRPDRKDCDDYYAETIRKARSELRIMRRGERLKLLLRELSGKHLTVAKALARYGVIVRNGRVEIHQTMRNDSLEPVAEILREAGIKFRYFDDIREEVENGI